MISVSQQQCDKKRQKQTVINQERMIERKKKIDEKKAKLDAANKQIEDMLLIRRETASSNNVPNPQDTEEHLPILGVTTAEGGILMEMEVQKDKLDMLARPERGLEIAFQSNIAGSHFSADNELESHNVSSFQPYSFLQDIYSSPTGSYANLTSRAELEKRNKILERENKQLREENIMLRNELDRRDLPNTSMTLFVFFSY